MSHLFIGREKELSKLDALYARERQSLTIVYGRRRIGKTCLLRKFAEGRDVLWFTAFEGNPSMLLSSFSAAVSEYFTADPWLLSFRDIKALLEFVFRESLKRRICMVIDEYPYLAEAFPESSSILQMLIDDNKNEGKLMLVLSGSSMHFMEHQVLGIRSPLYGRRDLSLKIAPFSYRETSLFCKGRDRDEVYLIWAITGGVPLYIEKFLDYSNAAECIREEFFSENGYFSIEAENIFRMEFREPRNYYGVCRMIAMGNNKSSAISSKLGLSTANAASILGNLEDIDIIEHRFSMKPSPRKPIWKIRDPFLMFWFSFCFMVDPMHMESNLKNNLNSFLGRRFEDMCRNAMPAAFSDMQFEEIGSWWGGNPRTHSEEEIDIVARTSDGITVFSECKRTNDKIGMDVLEKLISRSELVESDPERRIYALFSWNGFTDSVLASGKARCFDSDDVMALLLSM
ncbi:MAG: ATP-binding protein [Candidatus Ornithospirochaeta sp.]|nr:ATP-binding protein [Candidatus Ornithospirochaeta sp.]